MNKMRRRMQRDRRVNHRGWKYIRRDGKLALVNDRTGVIQAHYAHADDVIGLARMLPDMSPEEREDQRMDFAYGNLAASTNHKPSKSAFALIAQERGWSAARFANWASRYTWERV